jgi:hypothetical protein
MAEHDFGFVRRFLIDDGQLDGYSPQECFVLGYELATIDEAVSRGEAFSRPVHSANRERIELVLKDSSVKHRFTWLSDDRSETWVQLDIRG